ncbi:MAG: ATP--guanido phosphotransferase [Clostridia bacterium]|nr:ATP--guanido phosphotransferase [Clostridia bacterium]
MPTFNTELFRGNIITSRVRLARNLVGYPFRVKDVAEARDIIKKVNRALIKCDTFNLYNVGNLDAITLEAMKERHLISQNLIDNPECGAALINQDESVSIMINEEDHVREQCFMKGLRLSEAYKTLDKIDDELTKNLDVAYSGQLGFLTACPTNLGTGLRASVMMFLPALTESGKIGALVEEVSRLGLTVRGLYGEGSNAEGFMYQISNEVTLGVKEIDIIRLVEQTVTRICRAERDEMQRLYLRNELKTMDRARKAYGVLTNAVLLDYSEFLSNIAQVKLGAMLGMINISDIDKLDDLIVSARPAMLCHTYGKKLSALDRDLLRAETVGQKLSKIKE